MLPQAALAFVLAGCANTAGTPIEWFHDLEGGTIAADRPPPPGVGQPYPRLVSVPTKPSLPDPAYRQSLQEQLLAERDRTERLAARTPVQPAAPAAAVPASTVPSAANPGAAPAPAAAVPAAQASLPAADAPPPRPQPEPAAPLDAPVVLAGTPLEASGPPIPSAPPPPVSFDGQPPAMRPTQALPAPLPARLPAAQRGTVVLFLPGEAVLRESQMVTLRQIAGARHAGRLEITGLGEAVSDSPDGQAQAIDLALKRANAVAQGFGTLHVPAGALRLSAYAFGSGATVRITAP